jgi:hypothetical protein
MGSLWFGLSPGDGKTGYFLNSFIDAGAGIAQSE